MVEQKTAEVKRLKLMICIVDRGKGEKVAQLCRGFGATINLIFLGHGTANSELLNYLGIGESAKDLVFTVLEEEIMAQAMAAVEEKMKLAKRGNGIAFTIPINSVGGSCTLKFLSGICPEKE